MHRLQGTPLSIQTQPLEATDPSPHIILGVAVGIPQALSAQTTLEAHQATAPLTQTILELKAAVLQALLRDQTILGVEAPFVQTTLDLVHRATVLSAQILLKAAIRDIPQAPSCQTTVEVHQAALSVLAQTPLCPATLSGSPRGPHFLASSNRPHSPGSPRPYSRGDFPGFPLWAHFPEPPAAATSIVSLEGPEIKGRFSFFSFGPSFLRRNVHHVSLRNVLRCESVIIIRELFFLFLGGTLRYISYFSCSRSEVITCQSIYEVR